MLGVAGQWGLEIKVNGNDIGANPNNCSFVIINNIHQNLPSFSVSFKDATGSMINNPPRDGTPVSIACGLPERMNPAVQFVCIGEPQISHTTVTFQGVLNKISWTKKIVDKNFEGPTSSVIAQIAAQAGLIPDVDSTSDAMNWLPNRTSLVQFARHIMARSFSGEASAMMMAVTDTGKLKYKDLASLAGASASTLFSYVPGEGIPILAYATESKSAAANASQGYGATSIGVKEDGSIFEMGKVALKMLSSGSPISSAIQSAIGDLGARITNFAPLAGNTHEKWNEALHSNPRIKSTYAFDVSLLTNVPSFTELLSPVQIKPVNHATGEEATAVTGKYIVTAIAKTVVKNRYVEKVVATSQSVGGV